MEIGERRRCHWQPRCGNAGLGVAVAAGSPSAVSGGEDGGLLPNQLQGARSQPGCRPRVVPGRRLRARCKSQKRRPSASHNPRQATVVRWWCGRTPEQRRRKKSSASAGVASPLLGRTCLICSSGPASNERGLLGATAPCLLLFSCPVCSLFQRVDEEAATV